MTFFPSTLLSYPPPHLTFSLQTLLGDEASKGSGTEENLRFMQSSTYPKSWSLPEQQRDICLPGHLGIGGKSGIGRCWSALDGSGNEFRSGWTGSSCDDGFCLRGAGQLLEPLTAAAM